jgi:hypothetical protein
MKLKLLQFRRDYRYGWGYLNNADQFSWQDYSDMEGGMDETWDVVYV